MDKEKLMQWGLTEEQAAKVMEGLNGSFVTKTRFNEANEELKAAKAAITQRDGQLDTLKASGADAGALKQQIAQLQADNAAKDQAHAEEIKKLRLDNAVDRALTDARAINPATVKPLLAAFLEKADLDDDGTVRGLADEIGKLAKAEGTGFLFKPAEPAPKAPSISGTAPAGNTGAGPGGELRSQAPLADARKAGNAALAVAIKREAAADGVALF